VKEKFMTQIKHKPVNEIVMQSVESFTPLFGFDLTSKTYELQMAREAVYELQMSNPEKRTSNVYGEWMSPKNSHEINAKLQPICDLVVDVSKQIWTDCFRGGQDDLTLDFYVWQCWAIKYGDGGFANSHHHLPSFFSSVIYLESDEESSPIVFGKGSPRPSTRNAMYVFPSILQHEVPTNKGNRVVLAMNIAKR
jgi:hypothetical protein